MFLLEARVTNFKSIDDSGSVPIEPAVTVLVGQNEAGKSAFLQALYQAQSVFGEDAGFNVTEEYPRKNLSRFKELHPTEKAVVTTLVYEVEEDDITSVNTALGVNVLKPGRMTVQNEYNGGGYIIGLQELFDEKAYVAHLLKGIELPEQVGASARRASTVKDLIAELDGQALNEQATTLFGELTTRFAKSSWAKAGAEEAWTKYIRPRTPRFFYFDDYRLLPGKANLSTLQSRVQQAKEQANPKLLKPEDQAILALLQMARVDLDDIIKESGYEEAKAKLEGVSNTITDQIFKYWRQNTSLEVVIDIKADPADEAPFNSGPNLYIRIRNQRHRVTVPFSQRSKGFIWFFSFLVWFDSVRQRAAELGGGAASAPLVLLLDEPGLNLHALAQGDLLDYVDDLAKSHQVIYTTHSPFMVRSERLAQVRVVEDKDVVGTKVSDRLDGSDPKTLFPLQAALGYTVAQNLFISKRNLLVEGVADLAYLQFFSEVCEEEGRDGLREDVTIVPVGGMDKVATFVALLGANDLELAVVHDYTGMPDARLESLVHAKVMRDKQLLSYADFRDPAAKKTAGKAAKAKAASSKGIEQEGDDAPLPTDIEDLISTALYIDLFNETFQAQLGDDRIEEAELPPGPRIIERINGWLEAKGIELRPSGGFNHYAPAKHLVSNPRTVDPETLARFTALFRLVNRRFSEDED